MVVWEERPTHPGDYPCFTRKLKSGAISKVIESLGSKLKRVGREYVTQCVCTRIRTRR